MTSTVNIDSKPWAVDVDSISMRKTTEDEKKIERKRNKSAYCLHSLHSPFPNCGFI